MSEQYRSKQTYPFMMIPHRIWEIGLTGNEIAVFLRIFYRAGFEHECFESRASISEACCLSQKTVSNCFAELERLNILQVTRRRVENKPNLITINQCDEWLSKRKNFPDEDRPREKITQDLGKNLHEPQVKITHGTIFNELDSTERDSLLVAAAEATALQTVSQGENSPPDSTLTNKTSDTWKAYAEWYERRYNVPPARNAKVNAQLKQFCERVGYEDAPKIIIFYLLQNDYWYVKQMHTIGVALSEAEKLVAGFRRGSLTTKREADYIDKTSSKTSFIQQILEVRRQKAQKGGTDEQDN